MSSSTCDVRPRTSGRPSYPTLPVGWEAMTDIPAPDLAPEVDVDTETEAERSLRFEADAMAVVVESTLEWIVREVVGNR